MQFEEEGGGDRVEEFNEGFFQGLCLNKEGSGPGQTQAVNVGTVGGAR